MRDHESLVKRYEDALIGLMLETGLENEGQAALEEMARFSFEAELRISEKATKKNTNLINKSFARQNAKMVGRGTGKFLKKTFLVAAVLTLLAGVAVASVPEIREKFHGFLIAENGDGGTDITAIKSGAEFLETIRFEWLPDGYELVDNTLGSTCMWNTYRNESGDQLAIDIYASENQSVIFDTEDAEIQNMVINGMDAMLIEKDIDNQLVMTDEQTGAVFLICAETLSSDDLIRIAQSIVF